MISNYFLKSKPIQNVFFIILFFIVFTTFSFNSIHINAGWNVIFWTIINFFIFLGTAILLKVMINELGLSKSSNFFALFFIAFLCFFPHSMLNTNLVLATFLSTFSMYRFLKIDFSTGSKLSIFDACLFIFTAAIFHFWVIIYSVLIVIATIRNYKKNNNVFLVPLVAFFNVFVLFLFFSLLFNPEWAKTVVSHSEISFNYNYFNNVYSRLAISFYFSILIIMLIFIVFQLISKPLLVQSAIKKIIFWLLLSLLVYILTPVKSNDLLIFSSIPLLIITSNYIEFSKDNIKRHYFNNYFCTWLIVFYFTNIFFMIAFKTYINTDTKHWITFVHGAGGSSAIWFKQIKFFQEHFNVLLLDLRGHGVSKNPSESKSYTFKQIASDVKEVLDYLKIETSHFVGISLGTIVIRQLAEMHPQNVKTMIMGGAILKMNFKSQILMRLGNVFKYILPYLLLYKLFAYIIMPKKNHKKSRLIFVNEAKKLYQKEFIKWFKLTAEINPVLRWFRQKELNIPTLYVMGDQDYIFLPIVKEVVAQHYNSSKLFVIEECGHVVNIEKANQFNNCVLDFLRADSIKN